LTQKAFQFVSRGNVIAERGGSAAGHTLAALGISILSTYLFSEKSHGFPSIPLTFDAVLALGEKALESLTIINHGGRNTSYVISSIAFAGPGREGVTLLTPNATLSNNGTQFNITFVPTRVIGAGENFTLPLTFDIPDVIIAPPQNVSVEFHTPSVS